jgi:hypothetical protein
LCPPTFGARQIAGEFRRERVVLQLSREAKVCGRYTEERCCSCHERKGRPVNAVIPGRQHRVGCGMQACHPCPSRNTICSACGAIGAALMQPELQVGRPHQQVGSPDGKSDASIASGSRIRLDASREPIGFLSLVPEVTCSSSCLGWIPAISPWPQSIVRNGYDRVA